MFLCKSPNMSHTFLCMYPGTSHSTVQSRFHDKFLSKMCYMNQNNHTCTPWEAPQQHDLAWELMKEPSLQEQVIHLWLLS